MSKTLRVLLIEDSEEDAVLVAREIERNGYHPFVKRVDTEESLVAALDSGSWQVVLSDFSMPGFSPLAALAILLERGLDLPFIIVSGTIGEETAVAGMRAGVHDFVMKANLTRLVPAIEREIKEASARLAKRTAEEELRESEARFRTLTERSLVGVFIIQSGSFLYVNPTMAEMFGYSAADMVGRMSPLDLAQPADHKLVADWMRGRLDGDTKAAHITFRGRKKDGPEITCESLGRRLEYQRQPAIIGTMLDITERKRSEERIQRQLQRLKALRQIDLAITSSLDPSLTFNVLLDQVTTNLAVDASDVYVFDPLTRRLNFAAGRGFRNESAARAPLKLGEGYAGRAALDRSIFSVPDLTEPVESVDPDPFFQAEGFVSYHAVPLLAKGTIKGVMEVFHRSRLSSDQEWLDFLQAIAGQAAIAIDNSAMFFELHRSTMELIRAYDSTLEGWIGFLDLRDKETEGHTQRVTDLSVRLAEVMGFSDEELVHVRRGALLHDIGKIGIPDSILLKPAPLSDEEWEVMRRHPEYAHKMLSPIGFLRPALDIPYCHHEKWDGTGYPRGLREEGIPLSARIFAVVDVWDALSNDRPYRRSWDQDRVRLHLSEQSGKHFDPQVVELFFKHESELVHGLLPG